MWKGMVLAGWLNRVVFFDFLQEGTPGAGIGTPCLRPFQNAKKP